MNILCIAASNSRKPLSGSVSYKVCQIVAQQIKSGAAGASAKVDVVSLKDVGLTPCALCGSCTESDHCHNNPSFNALYDAMKSADRLCFVVPHYSPLPSKLMALFEKINEITYAGWLQNPGYVSPLQGKPFAVIAHGGMPETEEVLSYYKETLIKPVTRTLESFGLVWAAPGDLDSTVFGLAGPSALQPSPDFIFPDILFDEERIADRIRPAVESLMK